MWIRGELNSQGSNYGIRGSYQARINDGSTSSFIPFDANSKKALDDANDPPANTMFIQIN